MSLRTRIAVIAAFAVAVAVVLVSVGAYFAARRELRAEIDESLIERATIIEAAAGSIPDEVRRFGARFGIPGIRPGPAFDTILYQVITPQGDRFVPANQEPLPPTAARELRDGPALRDVRVDGIHIRLISVDAGDIGVVQIGRPLTEVDATLSGLALVLVGVGVVGTMVAAAIGLVVARSALKPIDDLTDAAEHVAETQDLESRIAVDGDDEVGRLAASFNEMLAALDESRVQQRRLVRDAGHELRTPLTALRMNLELLARGTDLTPGQRTELLDSATAEVAELTDLVGEVVDVASDRFAEEAVSVVRLDDVAAASVERARRRTTVPLSLEADRSPIEGRPASLERAIDNLLDNAVKWSPEGGVIAVTVSAGRVAVRDHGPGIDRVDRDHVFDRFYRSPEARSSPGSGLGLSIVKQIVDDHGGTVFVEEDADGGAVVGFTIPLLDDQATGA